MLTLAEPLDTLPLFAPLSRELLALLDSLPDDAWRLDTACAGWSVKDVAAHLLGGNLGRLWSERSAAPAQASDLAALVAIINDGNQRWVEAARRISPAMLVELLALTETRLVEHFGRLDPHAPARAAVSWAGEGVSANWFDIAREYTEKWLHQAHVREAVGAPLLNQRRWLHPVLATFLRGLPHLYRDVEVPAGAALVVRITGPAGGTWSLRNDRGRWALYLGEAVGPLATVALHQDLAWRLWTRGVAPARALLCLQITGDTALGARVAELVAIMA